MASDPWQVQPHEHLKFAEHFRNLGPVNGALTGEQAKRFMLQSQLPPPVLGQIWSLADTNADGKLDLREFSIACKIINLKLHGIEVPKTLPPSLLASLSPSGGQKAFVPSVKPPIPPMPTMPPQQPLITGLPQSNQSLLGDFTSPTQPLPPSKPQNTVPDLISGVKPTPPIVPNQPLVGLAQPITSQLTNASQPVIGATQSLINTNQPIIGAQPLIGTQPLVNTQPLIASPPNQPLIGQPLSTQPLIGQPLATQPLISANAPLIPALPTQPLIPSSIVGPSLPTQVIPTGTTVAPLISSPPKPVQSVAGSIPGQPITSTPITGPASRSGSVSSKPASLVTSPTEPPLGVVSPPANMEWGIPQPHKLKYTQLFNATDRAKTGWVSGAQARSIMLQSRLPQSALAQIWAMADLDSDGKLGCEEFVLAMYLCEKATQGDVIPAKLPPELIPPTFRRESVTMQSSASFEARRRENMARGQAELERRRDQLADAHLKEKAERERKEREEAEKREKLRLEAQKKEQEELMRKQKEEQDKREAARKEMERQCQLEWEKKRTRELETMRTEEQSKVLALKAQCQALTGELATVNLRASNLAKDIRETRTQVAGHKLTIDTMRSDRDSSMAEMQQLKAKVKELNAKQIALNKEKAELDAKAKASQGAGEDGKLSMMEVTLKQLRDKVEAAKAIVETKKSDLDASNQQLSELTETVNVLSNKCQKVWELYEEKRQQYMEKKSTAPAEAWPQAEPDWGTNNDGWGASADEAWSDAPPTTATEPVSAAPVPRWRCVFEFAARTTDELSLQPGDLVSDATAPRGDAEPGWRWGTARGQSGWFPESYVEDLSAAPKADVVEPLEMKTQLEGIAEVPEAEIASDLSGAIPTVEGGDFYLASYPYNSAEPGDLCFEAGERIEVIRRDGDWWTGRIGVRTGIFPSNYVSKADIPPTSSIPSTAHDPIPTIPEAANEPEDAPAQAQPAASASDFSAADEHSSTYGASSEVAALTASPPPGASPPQRRDSGRDSVTRRGKEVAQAIASYTATSPEQLSLQKGQLLVVRKKADSGWWEGELQAKGRNRQVGWFPATYVKILQASGRTSGRTTPVMSKMDMPSETIIDKVN